MTEPVRALLFDLDGTLIHTGELHYQATIKALETFGKSIGREEYDQHIHGNNNTAIVRYLFPDQDQDIHDAYVDTKERLFRADLRPMAPIAGLAGVLEWASKRQIPVALVTNAPKENKDAMLSALGLTGRFWPVVLGDELPRGKPDPLPFLTALDILQIAPQNAMGFDDSAHGIRSASRAGTFVVGLMTGLGGAELARHGADLTNVDYTDQTLHTILAERDPGR